MPLLACYGLLVSASPSPSLAATKTVGFVRQLASHGAAVAVVTAEGSIAYRELAERVEDLSGRLGDRRRLVLVAARNDVESLVAYLAALSAGHPVLLVPGDHPAAMASLTAAWDPDVVVRGSQIEERRDGSAHELNRDLALLLSTSGSTGSPKLVRLSHTNLQANAESIADYLGIEQSDRAATTLPMYYCYGLSVINSHLLRGASLLLTDQSVVDPCFWDLFQQEQATTFAAVPHTFDLLDRVGFAEMDLPHLRYVTQAGGRLAADRVQRYAELGRRQGWDLFVMYGQTEATARMAYLPPELAHVHPTSIGVPVPGGSLRLRPVSDHPDPEVGELVYSGPNVMLGYADAPDDLALGRVIDSLDTGDLARRTTEGLFEIVGRRSRFIKVFGLRIDLQRAEEVFAELGLTVCCAGDRDQLVIAVEGGHDARIVGQLAATELGVPARAVRVCPVEAVPRIPSGKPDYAAVAALGRAASSTGRSVEAAATPPVVDVAVLRALYAELLDVPEVRDDDTFVSLGGDSLSYVETSIRLEELLGELPTGWHTTAVRELAPGVAEPRTRRGRAVETSVALRALAIVLVVATHAGLLDIKGSAHVLVAVAGFNFARFQLTSSSRSQRLRRLLGSVGRVAVPSMVWITGAYLLTDRYGIENVFLLNAVLGPPQWTTQWDFWFVEVLVLTVLTLAALLSVPWVDRAERRSPFAVACALLGIGLVWRFDLTGFDVLHTKPVLWLFALGWASAKAATSWQRVAITGVVLATVPGFFGDPRRDGVILAGVLLLLWAPTVGCPAWLSRPAAVLASASLYIYLTHWQVYPHLDDVSPLLAVLASLTVGAAYWQLSARVMRRRARRRAVGGAAHRTGDDRRRPRVEDLPRPRRGTKSAATPVPASVGLPHARTRGRCADEGQAGGGAW